VFEGIFTGRSPKDKWLVKQPPSDKEVGWGSVNQPMTPEVFDKLYDRVLKHYETVPEAYVFDGYCGTNLNTRKNVRFVTELAWQHHFVRNMFIRPESDAELRNFKPDFTVINACKVTNPDWKQQGLHSEVFIAFNIEKNVAIIGGTYYGGEMKKGIFSMMNYWLPLQGIMPMHCSANNGPEGTALFFGLSGTGKTTLSADPERLLIGDDEHGWDDDGIFNFEGGCYAKTIDLTREKEPQVWDAIKPNALLENVPIDPVTKEPIYTDRTKTENTRVSYPLEHVKERDETHLGKHPKNIIFLTADAYGVLPPVSMLTHEQAMYHFLSGYTAKVAGTERGVKEPTATFSSAFGAAFM
jgi:phosphoenolpyruvate carboxykinase (ATP)